MSLLLLLLLLFTLGGSSQVTKATKETELLVVLPGVNQPSFSSERPRRACRCASGASDSSGTVVSRGLLLVEEEGAATRPGGLERGGVEEQEDEEEGEEGEGQAGGGNGSGRLGLPSSHCCCCFCWCGACTAHICRECGWVCHSGVCMRGWVEGCSSLCSFPWAGICSGGGAVRQ